MPLRWASAGSLAKPPTPRIGIPVNRAASDAVVRNRSKRPLPIPRELAVLKVSWGVLKNWAPDPTCSPPGERKNRWAGELRLMPLFKKDPNGSRTPNTTVRWRPFWIETPLISPRVSKRLKR